MKRAVFFAGLFGVAFVCIVIACSSGSSFDCTADCTKEQECATGSTDGGSGGSGSSSSNLSDCEASCEKAKGLVQQAFLDAQTACDAKTCSERVACTKAAYGACTKASNYDSFVGAICTKISGCESSYPVATCKADFSGTENGYFNCLTNDAVDAIQSCVTKAACTTLQADYEKCIEDTLGVPTGASGGDT